MRRMGGLIGLLFACSLAVWGQHTAPARIIVTMGHYYGPKPPLLTANDLTLTQEYKPLTITSLTPLRADRTALELFVLVDNCSSCEAGSKVDELRQFIAEQPSTTSVGVAYIQDGRLHVAENPTPDRERAIKALNAPSGSEPASPYDALAELITGWKRDASRHVVLMISTGIDPAAADPESAQSKSAEAAVRAAQRAEVTVYAIYHPSANYATTDFSRLYAGQVQLSHVADETGGEAYFLSLGPLPSLSPFLGDINNHLSNEYLLEFLGDPGNSPGQLHDVEVKSNLPNIDLMAPYKTVIGVTGEKAKLAR